MVSNAQKRARAKYNNEKMVQKVVRFSPNESDLLAFLESHDNQAGYIKQLIREDMAKAPKKKPSRKKSIKEWKQPSLMYGVLCPYMEDNNLTDETITEEEMVSEVVWYLQKLSCYDDLTDYYGEDKYGLEAIKEHRQLEAWCRRAVKRLEEEGRDFKRY